jgi:pimeloyl-ACP methyl ester carboxylesterase
MIYYLAFQVRAAWRGPVLVIAGETDPTVPLSACQFVAERFDARLHAIEQVSCTLLVLL